MQRILKHKKLIVCIVIISSIFLLTCVVSADVPEDQYKTFLQQHPMSQQNMVSYCGRFIGWKVIAFLRWVIYNLQKAAVNINSGFENIFQNEGVTKILDKVKYIAIGLFVIMIAYIGFEYIFKKDQNKKFDTYVMNFVFGVIVFLGISTAIGDLYSINLASLTYLTTDDASKTVSMADEVVQDGITDNLLFKEQNGQITTDPGRKNDLNIGQDSKGKSDLDYIEINDWINPDEGAPFKKYLKDKETLDNIDTGPGALFWHMNILGNLYYRWNVKWLEILVQLFIMAFALIIMCIKIARLCYELVIHQIMAQVLALIDIHSGQRLKKVLQSIVATFITIFGCFLFLKLYMAGNTYILAQDGIKDNFLAKIICMLALGLSVIDGPNIFEQVVGIDAGLNNTTSAILQAGGIMAGARALGKGIKGAARGISAGMSGAKKAVSMAGGAAGAVAGTMAGRKTTKAGGNTLPFSGKNAGGGGGGASGGSPGGSGGGSPGGAEGSGGAGDNSSGVDESAKLGDMSAGEFAQVLKDALKPQERPQTLGDRIKNRPGAEKSTIGRTRNAYNLTKEAAFNSVMRRDYINNRAAEIGSKRQAKKDYKTNMDKHFGG